jgi:hypothetical protein
MKAKSLLLIGLVGIIALALVIVLTAALTPENTNPAFATAVTFVNAAVNGDDAAAMPLLTTDMQVWVGANCPDASVSACVQAYTPPEWGGLLKAVFRRATPDGDAWDVDIIATYAEGTGFSGVCIYTRVEPDAAGNYLVAGWAGFVHCGDPASRTMASNPDAPNRAP